MSNVTRVLGAAGNTQGIPANAEDLFSTFVYKGTGGARTITNNINLSGEGGLVWTKKLTGSSQHAFIDTVRGATKKIGSSTDGSEGTEAQTVTGFTSTGFTLGTDDMSNASGSEYCSWTFRKAPNFFDIVTYTGTGSATTIAHNLGSAPGMIAIKNRDAGDNWAVYHRGVNGGSSPQNYALAWNLTNTQDASSQYFNNTAPTGSAFSIGTSHRVNASGEKYVAYLFAHNTSGGFGPDGDKNLIQCGTYNGSGGNSQLINLGFEVQWLMLKNVSHTGDWTMYDMMRQFRRHGDQADDSRAVYPNTAGAQSGIARVFPTNEGFGFEQETGGTVNEGGRTYIYVAIAREMAVPTAATDVFSIDTEDGTEPRFDSNHIVDLGLTRQTHTGGGSSTYAYTRIKDERVVLANDNGAQSGASEAGFDFMNGHIDSQFSSSTSTSWMWKRAPKYFDIVTYKGNNGAGHNVTHNLGVPPEMMWIKKTSGANNWKTFHLSLGATKSMELNTTVEAETNGSSMWNSTVPTSSVFTLGSGGDVNSSSHSYIAYLFATLPGISKVGSYSGNGGTQNIECGFSSGARFVLIKRTDTAEGWKVHDTLNGIVAGNDPFIELNNTNAQNAGFDLLDPYDGGFTVNNYAGWNGSGGSYIFYAVA